MSFPSLFKDLFKCNLLRLKKNVSSTRKLNSCIKKELLILSFLNLIETTHPYDGSESFQAIMF